MLLDNAIDQFIDHLRQERQLSAHTVQAYSRDLHTFEKFCTAQEIAQCDRVLNQHVREFINKLHRQGLIGRSLQRKLSSLRTFFNYLLREKKCSSNPTADLRPPKTPRLLPNTLDVDQTMHLLQTDSNDPLVIRDQAILELFYSSGLRLSELISLNLDTIDYQAGLVPVVGKGNKMRLVPVGKKAIDAVNRWLTLRAQFAAESENALFVSKQGKRIHPRTIQKRLREWGIKQSLDSPLHPHRMRHAFASHMLESSGNLRAVQSLLGHADISTTQIYTRLDFQHLSHVYDSAHPRAKKKG